LTLHRVSALVAVDGRRTVVLVGGADEALKLNIALDAHK
jgi:hypothetical protein